MAEKIYTFCLPDIGEGVVEGEVVEWLKNVGDSVSQDEPVVVVMTDKATVELPAPYPGKIHKQYYKPGEISIKDKPLYDILLEDGVQVHGEQKTRVTSQEGKPAKENELPKENEPSQKVASPKTTQQKDGKVKAIPKVRHEAKEWGINLSAVSGSGQDGRVTEEDLRHAVARKEKTYVQLSLEGDEEQQLLGVRGLMAKKMHETHIPQFSYFEQADATRLIQLRQNIKGDAAQDGINLSYMPFLMRALSLSIKRFPQMNASIDMQGGKVVFHKQQNIGIAMATPQGLIVPVLKGIETMGMKDIIHAYEEMKAKAVAGKLASGDMKDGTITISNFGVLGGEGLWATPMIIDPEVAILAVAKIRKVPVVKGEEIVIRDVLPLSWSFDHRLIDGDLAAQISHHYSNLLKNPASLL
ncbi:MAG TPA: dihydrolipoamide acetyltransferase family protein [Parachlamydiaceae bacterium]|nr:dihydrolipoamide acetyltransferase family protein [Parachlamydiaceae bacterium]